MVNFTDELSEDSSIHCMQNEAWDSAILKYFWKDFLFIDVCTIKKMLLIYEWFKWWCQKRKTNFSTQNFLIQKYYFNYQKDIFLELSLICVIFAITNE